MQHQFGAAEDASRFSDDAAPAPSPVGVCRITEADIPHVVDLARQLHAESSFARYDFDPEVLGGLIRIAIDNPKMGFCAIAWRAGEPVGAFLGLVTNFFFGKTPMAQELGLFVKPEARGSSAAFRLCRAFEDWARDNGAGVAQVGIAAGINDDQATRLYERLGYEHAGAMMRKDLA